MRVPDAGYETDGDVIKFCVCLPERGRPSHFDTTAATGCQTYILKRLPDQESRTMRVDVTETLPGSPTLYIFSGLPGTGKTTLAKMLARRLNAAYLRIDTVEQGLRELCSIDVQGEGYMLSYRLAADNLGLGMSVVADSCNPLDLTRGAWEKVAADANVQHANIEVVCSDPAEHRRRVESRKSSIPGLRLPTWVEVERREYARWATDRCVIDTAGRSAGDCFDELISHLRSRGR